jgi:hypothetical protein
MHRALAARALAARVPRVLKGYSSGRAHRWMRRLYVAASSHSCERTIVTAAYTTGARTHASARAKHAPTPRANACMRVRAHAVRRVACFAHLELSDVQIAAERAAAALVPEWAFHIRV